MRPFLVIDIDGFAHHATRLSEVGGRMLQQLVLQDAVDALSQRILVAVVTIGYRADCPMLRVQALVQPRAVLDASVGVMHQWFPRRAAPQRLAVSSGHRLGVQAVVDVIADDLARIGIGDQAQVQRTALARQITNVRHPYLLRGTGQHLLRPWLEQIRMTIEPVKAVSGLVVRPLGFDQQTMLRQYAKKTIPTHMERCPGLILQQEMQLARSQAGLPHPYLTHDLGNQRILLGTPVRRERLRW